MDRARWRLGGLLAGYVVLIVGSLLAMDWFVVDMAGMKLGISLRAVEVCALGVPCVSMSLSYVKGFYTTLAMIAFWGTIAFSLPVLFQGGSRLLTGYANPMISRRAYLPAMTLVLVAGAAGYLFGPDVGRANIEMMSMMSIEVTRTFAPLMLIGGLGLGIAVLHISAAEESDDVGSYQPLPVAIAKAVPASPPEVAPPAPAPAATPPVHATQPAHLEGKLAYAVRSGEITKMGIDAWREDGEPVLVLWRDLVAVVVRRLPAELDGALFVDLVSRPGSTLRLLPWTRLTGEAAMASDNEGVRSLVAALRTLAPEVRLDGATRNFVDTMEAPAQFPDRVALETHDARVDRLGEGR
ncbi:MAG: hypothetical protein SFX73_18575 [Kofleriaceae bacterium]|nr:hypothetical protein [Kofleriaceae bacterium]